MEWQPIETAPKDGTPVKVRHEDCPGYDCAGWWHPDGWIVKWWFISPDMGKHKEPTHWKPLE